MDIFVIQSIKAIVAPHRYFTGSIIKNRLDCFGRSIKSCRSQEINIFSYLLRVCLHFFLRTIIVEKYVFSRSGGFLSTPALSYMYFILNIIWECHRVLYARVFASIIIPLVQLFIIWMMMDGCKIYIYFFRNNNIISVPNNAQKNVISKLGFIHLLIF